MQIQGTVKFELDDSAGLVAISADARFVRVNISTNLMANYRSFVKPVSKTLQRTKLAIEQIYDCSAFLGRNALIAYVLDCGFSEVH